MVALIAFPVRGMDRHIDGHAVAADQLLGKVAGDLGPVLGADLGRQGQLPFAGGDGVAAGLAGLDFVPEAGPVRGPVRRVLRCQDEGFLDALLAGVIVDAAFALALDALTDTVGRGCSGRAPGAAFDRLHREVVAGHPPYPRPMEAETIIARAAADPGPRYLNMGHRVSRLFPGGPRPRTLGPEGKRQPG